MTIEEKRKIVIETLRNYNADSDDYKSRIVLAAPSHGDPNLLRAYMNGGNIGKIVLKGKKVTTGISYKYSNKYKGTVPTEALTLKIDSGKSETARLDAIISKEYLEYVKAATTAYSVKTSEDSDKERTIETLIMNFENQKSGNAAVDMEMQYSVEDHFGWTREKIEGHTYVSEMEYKGYQWFNEYEFSNSKDTKSPRVDLMVLNDNGVGFVELKVDNQNCDNLGSHINHMKYILTHKEPFIKDAKRRLEVLEGLGLLEPEMSANLSKWKENNNIWCGILFVGAASQLKEAQQMIKNQLSDDLNISSCFMGTEVVKNVPLNLASEIFVSKKEFVSENYSGVF